MTGNTGARPENGTGKPRTCWRSRNISEPCRNCGRYDNPCHCGACSNLLPRRPNQ